MNSDSCLVLHPAGGMQMRMSRNESDRSDGMGSTEVPQSNQQTSSESSPSGSSAELGGSVVARHITDVSEASEPPSFGSSSPGSNGVRTKSEQQEVSEYRIQPPEQEDHTATNDNSDEDTKPQHETFGQDEDFELSLTLRRNRRVLLSRLQETAPRGRLSLINLTRRGIGPEEALLLKQAIIANPQLSVLKLSYNELGDEGAAIIATGISQNGRHHAHLSVLDLGFNSIGDAGCDALVVHALALNYNLQTLYLSGNQIKEKGALSIAGAILHGTGVTKLYISANRIGSMGLKAIAGAIATNDARVAEQGATASEQPCMAELYLGSTDIESSGFISIPGMLLSNSSIRCLCLSNNNVDDNDMMLLSQALSQNKQVPLERLRLSFNEITCQGVECLMNAVWGSTYLREIKLDNNRLQDRGAQLCAVVLTSIPLEILDIGFNRVTTVGIKALMKNISENNYLQSLGMCGIHIDQNASKAISFALAYNTTLRAIYLDNCSAGYSAQRHIVAGIVSNRKASLRMFTGFSLGPIAMTLGVPRLPEEWTNEQVLGFFCLMWQQWLIKSGRGTIQDGDALRGPAPPAAVAAAAKVAFSSLGASTEKLFQAETHEKPIAEGSPVDPASAALIERTDSGTLSFPNFDDELVEGELSIWPARDSKESATSPSSPTKKPSIVRSALENPERRNKNLEWLRLHFQAISDVGRLPFNKADLWQLHQYFFSPPSYETREEEKSSEDSADSGDGVDKSVKSEKVLAPPPTPALPALSSSMSRAISFQALGNAFAISGILSHQGVNKRRPHEDRVEDNEGPAAKRAKFPKPRIAFYPRIMTKIQSYGNKPEDQALSLLRQLKYAENIMYAGKNPYTDLSPGFDQERTHSDIEMILLDLL